MSKLSGQEDPANSPYNAKMQKMRFQCIRHCCLAGMSTSVVMNMVREVLHSCQAIDVGATAASQSEDRNMVADHGLSATAERQLML